MFRTLFGLGITPAYGAVAWTVQGYSWDQTLLGCSLILLITSAMVRVVRS